MPVARTLRQMVKSVLRRFDRKIIYAPRGFVSGTDLQEDLRCLISSTNPVCIDVGANEGQTIEMLRQTLRNPIIHAFEPSSDLFEILQSRHQGPEVFVHHCALGSEPGSKEFINFADSRLSSFLALDTRVQNPFRAVQMKNTETVRMTTVDHFLQCANLSAVDLLKIDTQGYDMEVLVGALLSIRRQMVRAVLVELNFVHLYQGQADALDIIRLLHEHRLFLVDLYEKNHRPNRLAWCTALFSAV